MDRGDETPGPGGGEEPAAVACDAEGGSHEGLGGGGAEGDDQVRSEKGQFRFQPWAAGGDLPGAWLLVQAALAVGWLEFEMLDGVGDINVGAVDAGLLQRPIEQFTGRTDERVPGEVLLVTRLFADEHDPGRGRPLA